MTAIRVLSRNLIRDASDRLYFGLERRRYGDEPLRVAILYIYFDTKRYPDSARTLTEMFRWHPPYISSIVQIDNFHSDKEVTRIDERTWDIPGDNTWREFSGWERGVQFLAGLDEKPDVVVCVNEAFMNYGKAGGDVRYLRRLFGPRVLREARTALIGVHGIPDTKRMDAKLFGHDVSRCIRTHFFSLPYLTALEHLRPVLTEDQVNELFDLEWSGRVFRPNNACSSDLEAYLTEWVTKGWRWSMEPDADNWPAIRMKLVALLNERLLTASILDAGVPVRSVPGLRWWQMPKLVDWLELPRPVRI